MHQWPNKIAGDLTVAESLGINMAGFMNIIKYSLAHGGRRLLSSRRFMLGGVARTSHVY
jgi:hypothetical protein